MVYRFYCMTLFHSQTRRHMIKFVNSPRVLPRLEQSHACQDVNLLKFVISFLKVMVKSWVDQRGAFPSVFAHLSLWLKVNHWAKFKKKLHTRILSNTLYQTCPNGFSRATRALHKKYFKQHLLNHWFKFKIISQIWSS